MHKRICVRLPRLLPAVLLLALMPLSAWAQDATNDPEPAAQAEPADTYSQKEVMDAARGFFGNVTEGLAKGVERVFQDLGEPVGYIAGEEVSGAIAVGLRYGQGSLNYKSGGQMPVYWTGPSIGFDLGGNASKVFTLVYDLERTADLFQRFPAVDGSYYFVAGVGVNYQRTDGITLAPIRTGVGLRAGASIGYMNYTRKKTWNPL
ncbi:MAG: DUF1134 domain-containing protein [Gammaproteobacteria bacterium]|nr:DUF1134 domain-containing protein [Gammaproteobacteria bacterium]